MVGGENLGRAWAWRGGGCRRVWGKRRRSGAAFSNGRPPVNSMAAHSFRGPFAHDATTTTQPPPPPPPRYRHQRCSGGGGRRSKARRLVPSLPSSQPPPSSCIHHASIPSHPPTPPHPQPSQPWTRTRRASGPRAAPRWTPFPSPPPRPPPRQQPRHHRRRLLLLLPAPRLRRRLPPLPPRTRPRCPSPFAWSARTKARR